MWKFSPSVPGSLRLPGLAKALGVLIFAAVLPFPRAPALFGLNRSFDAVFPQLDEEERAQVFSGVGHVVSLADPQGLSLSPNPAAGIALAGIVEERKPAFLVESLLVIPYPAHWDGAPAAGELLPVYNALGKIRNLEGRVYRSFTRGAEVPLFEEATRIAGPKKTSPLPDPTPAGSVPDGETFYIRLKDANFGNSFYRADIERQGPGLLYSLTNFRNLTYLFIPVIKEEKFFARLYFELLAEGILVYSIAGADVSDFVAARIDMPSAIRKRLEVITGWVIDGIRAAPPPS